MSLAAPLAALFFGAVGSTHCAAMCGGFAALGSADGDARPVRRLAGPEADGRPRASRLVAQHAGRISSYALLGALGGGLGAWVLDGPLARYGATALDLLAGATLLFAGLALIGITKSPFERAGAPLFRRLAPLASRLLPLRSSGAALLFGAAWGLLPCGLVYSALSMAIASGSAASGAAVMLAFGLGTAPMLVGLALLARRISLFTHWTVLRIAAGVLFAVWGGMHVESAANRWAGPAAATHCACHAGPSG